MEDEAYWTAVRATRLDVADLLESLTPAEWDAPSLCRGWRIRDVAGHLSSVTTITVRGMLRVAPAAGFNPDRINTLVAVRHGERQPEDLVDSLRAHAGDRRTSRVLDSRNALFDVIVHSQDIAVPLDRQLEVPAERSRAGLQRVWEMGWPFRARRRFAGLSLRATDTDWRVGTGPEVEGSALSLLVLLTGRVAAALPHLHGAGVGVLHATV